MGIFIIIIIICVLALVMYIYGPKEHPSVKVGLKAPDFRLPDEENHRRSLSEFKGKKIVLYFYPKDNTPGCTAQACGIRDNYHLFTDNKITVLGINYDTPTSHKHFKQKHKLPFTLLSDTTKEVAKKYGAYASLLNNFYPERKTFLIDEKGVIVKILDNVDINTHVASILKGFGIDDDTKI